MMANCGVCRIVLSENDLPLHNKGKRHMRNLVRMKLLSPTPADTSNKTPLNKANDSRNEPVNHENKALSLAGEGCETKIKTAIKNDKLPSSSENTESNTSTKKNPKQPGVQRKNWQKRKLKDDSPKTSNLPDFYVNNLGNFDQQVISFIRQVELTDKHRLMIDAVLMDVGHIFSHVIPGVVPVLYGSAFTGLAFKTSDIDAYLYDPRGGEPDRDFIQREGAIIYKFGMFSRIVRITTARVPVIKATHINTGIEIDISATSGQAVANSRLLRFLLSQDSRIRSLMMVIGFYGKKYTLIAVNKFSRYSINLLIIFYLQNLPSPILPPLCKVVYGSSTRPWPCFFREHRLLNNNKQSLAELFKGFFEFYLNFPFSDYVISTYCGEKIAQNDMDKEEILDKMFYYKDFIKKGGCAIKYRDICVQDPLELNHNITKGITKNVLQQFNFVFTNVLQILNAAMEQDWLNEMMTINYVPPYLEKCKGSPVSFNVKYSYSGNDWITSIKKSFESVFMALGMEVDWNCPIPKDDAKKTKLSPGLPFIIQTKKFIYPKGLKWCLNQLKSGNYNLEQFRNSLLEITQDRSQTVFSAQCYVSLDQPNQLTVSMKYLFPRVYFKMLPFLRNNLEMLLNLVS